MDNFRIDLKRKEEIEFEEILSLEEDEKGDGFLERRIEIPVSKQSFLFLLSLLFFVFFLSLLRVFYLSVLKHQEFLVLARDNVFRTVSLEMPRGLIYDRNGVVLAKNVPAFSLFLNREETTEDDFSDIKRIVGLDKEEWQKVEERIKASKEKFVLLKKNISQEEAVKISANKIKGLYLITGLKRVYPKGEIFSSIIGYLGEADKRDLEKHPEYLPGEMVGKGGLEKFYQNILRGRPSRVLIKKGKEDELSKIVLDKGKPGKDIKLTIDAKMQEFLFSALREQTKALGAKRGLAVVENPQTGEILSLVSLPSYDNNIFIERKNKEIREVLENKNHPLFNKVVSGLYPPGSTIKPFLALAGLEEGIVSPETTINDRPGYIALPNPYFPEKPSIFRDWKVHGLVDLRKAIAVSCDIYFYYLGGGYKKFKGLGAEKIKTYLEKFNFSQKTGIDLPSESENLLPDPSWKEKKKGKKWTIGDTYHLSIGQGDILLTPISLLNSYSALINGGNVYQPYLNLSKGKKLVKKIVFEKDNWQEVIAGLFDVTQKSYGTGYFLKSLPIKVAGKSGTAQVKNGKEINSLFLAHFPVKNPEIALLVMIENTKEHQLNVLPVVKKFFLWYNKRQENKPEIFEQ